LKNFGFFRQVYKNLVYPVCPVKKLFNTGKNINDQLFEKSEENNEESENRKTDGKTGEDFC